MRTTTLQWLERTLEWGTAAIRLLPPEPAHGIGLKLLRSSLWRNLPPPTQLLSDLDISMEIPGVGPIAHPVGLAAGMDKDCDVPQGLRGLGFSFLEVGTVTPQPQSGNPGPRLFRAPGSRALINRMGFNNLGLEAMAGKLAAARWNHSGCPLAVNIGKNKVTPEDRALDDYALAAERFAPLAAFLVVNISSPNTPGLRNLATPEFIRSLSALMPQEHLGKIWIKLDPDLPKRPFQEVVSTIGEERFGGVVLTNTHRIEKPESGGLSGHPLAIASTSRLEWAWEVHRGALPMLGVGGIFSGLDVIEKISRGACAVEIYTSLIYRGPLVVHAILRELAQEMRLRGIRSLRDIQGSFFKG